MNRKTILEATGQEDSERVYKVDLTNQHIRIISLVKEFDKLRCLVLNYNLIDRIENLQCFPDLRELHLESNNIDRLAGLEGNKVLQVLNLRSNRIEKIENIGHLIKLETLVLDHNRVTKVSGLEYLKDLKNLYASHNRIESVQNFPSFSKLQNLNLSHNKIKNIPSALFNSLRKVLVFLDLSNNRIQASTFLQTFEKLESLNLSHNQLRELQMGLMPNLESLNVSHNQIETLPSVKNVLPELVSMNVSYNMICTDIEILSSLAEAEYLTEFDCRENPLCCLSFESGIQKIHGFDFLNGKTMTQAGAKYHEKINQIQDDLIENQGLYGEDDKEDREIKMSGFFDDQLEFRMTGMKVNRPSSPTKNKKMLQKPTFYEDIDKNYHDFMDNDRKIKVIREHYLKICSSYDIKSSQTILTELPVESIELTSKVNEKPPQEERRQEPSQHLIASENEIRKQNQKNISKWKELKQREKSFNIREVIKRSRGKDHSVSRTINASTGSNWNGNTVFKGEKIRNELLRTQALPRKPADDVAKTVLRPRSVRKKE